MDPATKGETAGLGACTSMTMRLYADRKGLAAERFSVRLSHRRVRERAEQHEQGEPAARCRCHRF